MFFSRPNTFHIPTFRFHCRINREQKEKIVKAKNLVSGNKQTKEQALREFEKQGKFSKSVHIVKVRFNLITL